MSRFASWSEPWFGTFREEGDAYALCPSVMDFVDEEWDPALRQKSLDYLTNGFIYAVAGGGMTCVFNGEYVHATIYYTDSTWAWDSQLAHYVTCHDVRLPDNFVSHMASHDFLPPPAAEPADGNWFEWSQKLPHPPFLIGKDTTPHIIAPLPPIPDVVAICLAAEEPFRAKRYAEAAALLGSVAEYLSPSQARRYEYARKRSGTML